MPSTQEKLHKIVQEAHDEIQQRRYAEATDALRQALKESRDAVLTSAPAIPTRYFRRLPSSGEPPLLATQLCCLPCNDSKAVDDDAASNEEQSTEPQTVNTKPLVTTKPLTVRFRGAKNNKAWSSTIPTIPLEGAPDALPPTSATAYLKTHYATEDEPHLSYVPYFGDDHNVEDVMAELFDTERREDMLTNGPEYKERAVNGIIDDTLACIEERLKHGIDDQVLKTLAQVMGYQDVERIQNRHNNKGEQAAAATPKSSKPKPESDYLATMDSFRECFCRRCFTFDCNMHGNLRKPNLQLQGELAVQKEKDGHWNNDVPDDGNKKDSSTESEEMSLDDGKPAAATVDQGDVPEERPNKRKLSDHLSLQHTGSKMKKLTDLQKSICERAWLMHQGDVDKIAVALKAPRELVADYIKKHKAEFEHVQPEAQVEAKKRKTDKTTSMKNYNYAWLKKVEETEIHPFFTPCDHVGPCCETNCSCIKNAFFCSKHCVWGAKSRNFFRGCACKGNRCQTKSCACFAAKRECDPDLCHTCGACTDPPNQPATQQRCRNDNISMRRHCHLLKAESTIENAGWGLFTKHALKKGDFIHEYVGEVISQEEGERRGVLYDKVNQSYLFNLCSDFVVDASRMGNKTRFANHSKEPNCETKMISVNGDVRIGLFAKEDIDAQEELFFDYRYDVSMENHLITKPGMTVEWMTDPKMANKVSKNPTIPKKQA